MFLKYKNQVMAIIAGGFVALLLLVIGCNDVILANSKYVLPTNTAHHERIGIVLGAGIDKSNKPYKELRSRLDAAAEAYRNGQVDTLIVSGDNRFDYYNEPDAMKHYLVLTQNIPASKIHPDYAGRSTYESCERAAKVFNVKSAYIISARSHLPRAVFICRHFGIEAYGLPSKVEANNAQRREIQARVKAIYNVYIHGENTVLGKRIKV